MDFAVLAEYKIKLKESEKKDKYHDLSRELRNYGTEYCEECWRLEETFCHSNSSERPSANFGVKNSNE